MALPQIQEDLLFSDSELRYIQQHQDTNSIGQHRREVTQAIFSRSKIKDKLPTWFAHPELAYPLSISLEQCSSEHCAHYKSSLVHGQSFIDLTGGFGVDTYYFSKTFQEGIYVERNETLAKIVSHNFALMKVTNVDIIHQDTLDFLKTKQQKVDLIYIDPARRDKQGKKTILLSDYEPNLLEILDQLLAIASVVMVKTSPMLDIKAVIQALRCVKDVHIVSLDNECKEVLYVLERNYIEEATIHCIHLNSQQAPFRFRYSEEKKATCTSHLPLTYIYEPNVSILKSGAFKLMGTRYNLHKLHPNTHLYTSNHLLDDFPGKRFIILHQIKVQKSALMAILPSLKANIMTRNFPMKTEDLKKKLGVKDGGEFFILATTLSNEEKVLILCKKVI